MPMLPVDTTNLYIEDAGSGPAIVLVHGWGSSTRVWNAQIADLCTDHRVVAYDFRGCGRSGRPATGNTIARNAQDVLDLCASLELSDPVLVGSSIGAAFALEAARRAPDAVAGVVSVDGPGHGPYETMAAELPTLRADLVRDRAATLAALVPGWYGAAASDAMVQWTIRQILDSSAHIDVLFDDVVAHDPRPGLAELEVPVLLVHGRDDAATPVAISEQLATVIAQAELLLVDDAGHMPQQEQPRVVTDAIRAFAARVQRAPRSTTVAA